MTTDASARPLRPKGGRPVMPHAPHIHHITTFGTYKGATGDGKARCSTLSSIALTNLLLHATIVVAKRR